LLSELEKQKASGAEFVEGLEGLMEEELICTICSELFIEVCSTTKSLLRKIQPLNTENFHSFNITIFEIK
jgi:hypothetical protein